MASITTQKVGGQTYLYESISYWDKTKKRPRNTKIAIGKLDPVTREPIYKQEYIDRMVAAGTPVKLPHQVSKTKYRHASPEELYPDHERQEIFDSLKDYGVIYFLRSIAEKINLLDILAQAIPDVWQDVFMLACYLVATDKPVMYCDDWLTDNAGLDVEKMSSQRISEVLGAFGETERQDFYQAWHKLIGEQEYTALDITSVSAYTRKTPEIATGFNPDQEKLPPVNICLLFGKETKLPVFQTTYSGSLWDVSTRENTLAEFTSRVGESDLLLVVDKGFSNTKNINTLLANRDKKSCRFLVPVPFTNKFALNQVLSERSNIDQLSKVIQTTGTPVRGVHKLRAWGNKGQQLHTLIYFDPEMATRERNELFGEVTQLKAFAEKYPGFEKNQQAVEHYLSLRKSSKSASGFIVKIREDAVKKENTTTGWLVLVSNRPVDAQTALDIYQTKDMVEKGFYKYKSNLGLDRLRLHGSKQMQNKVFVAFIALILESHIYNCLKKSGLSRKMTLDRLIMTLAKLKLLTIGETRILRPITKEQRTIFDAFNVALPE
jgi:transposase